MNRATAVYVGRACTHAALTLSLLGFGVNGAAAAEPAASARSPLASQLLQQRFTTAVEGWRKTALGSLPKNAHEADIVRDLRVLIAPTPVPLVHVRRRLDGNSIVVSAGWLEVLEQLLRVEANMKTSASPDARDCLDDYADLVRDVVRENVRRVSQKLPEPLHAWPRFEPLLLNSHSRPGHCIGLSRTDLKSVAVQDFVDRGMDAAALWLLTREVALLLAAPLAPPVRQSSVTGNVPSTKQGDHFKMQTPPQRIAPSAVVIEASASAAQPPVSAAEERAQAALLGFGWGQSRALMKMRENAEVFFDAN